MNFDLDTSSVLEEPTISDSLRARWLSFVIFVLAALPAAIPAILIAEYGVNGPYYDQWYIASTSIEFRQLRIPSNLFALHNEHRITVPRLIYGALDNLTHYNQFVTMYTGFAIVCITSLGIYLLLRSTIQDGSHGKKITHGAWFLCNLLIFSPVQWENWLWGIGLINFLPMMFIVWAIIAARSKMRLPLKTSLALLLATAATFSDGGGILSWPLVGLIWLFPPVRTPPGKKVLTLAIWSLGFAVNMVMYFHHYIPPGRDPSLPPLTASLFSQYLLAFLGSPFGVAAVLVAVEQSIWIGAVLLVIFFAAIALVLWIWSQRDHQAATKLLTWIAIGGFSLGAAFLASILRAQSGVAQALGPKYSSFSLYLPVALIAISILVAGSRFRPMKRSPVITITIIASIAVLHFYAIPTAIMSCQLAYSYRLRIKTAVLLIHSLPADDPDLMRASPTPDRMLALADSLNAAGFMHPRLVPTNHVRAIQMLENPHKKIGHGCLDQAVKSDPDHLFASGWAILPEKGKPADAVVLTWDHFDDDPIIFAFGMAGLSRPDVAQWLKQPRFELSGWSAICPITRLPAGKPLRIRAWAFDLKTARVAPLTGEVALTR